MKDKALEFLNAIHENADIRKYMEDYNLPEGKSKEDGLLEAAKHFGYEITKEDLLEAFKAKQEELKASLSSAQAALGELSSEELDTIVGGKDVEVSDAGELRSKKEHPECKDTFKMWENCWFNDGCDMVFNYYKGYIVT